MFLSKQKERDSIANQTLSKYRKGKTLGLNANLYGSHSHIIKKESIKPNKDHLSPPVLIQILKRLCPPYATSLPLNEKKKLRQNCALLFYHFLLLKNT